MELKTCTPVDRFNRVLLEGRFTNVSELPAKGGRPVRAYGSLTVMAMEGDGSLYKRPTVRCCFEGITREQLEPFMGHLARVTGRLFPWLTGGKVVMLMDCHTIVLSEWDGQAMRAELQPGPSMIAKEARPPQAPLPTESAAAHREA